MPDAWSGSNGATLTGETPSFTAPTELLTNEELVFTLIVTDASGIPSVNDDTNTVTITVIAGPNDAPTAHAGDDATVAEGASVTLDGSASADPEGENLTYAWSGSNGATLTGETPSFTAPTELLSNEELVFTLIVTDASGIPSVNADTNTVTITVTAGPNDAPTAHAGTNATVNEGVTVTLNGSASTDPEGEALTYAWSGSNGVILTGETPSFTAPTELLTNEELVFTLIVTDASGIPSVNADTNTVTITVTAGPNDAPTAHAGDDATVAEGAPVTLDGSGSTDPEGENLTYAWSGSNGATLTGETPSFTAPTELLANTELVFTLIVTDASGIPSVNDDTNTVTITVTAGPNDAPTAHAGDDATVAEGAPVMLDGSASTDPEGENLTYAWSGSNGDADG